MTALTATPQAGSGLLPARVLLQVTAAPNPPATSYVSNFATLDSWTSPDGATLTVAGGGPWSLIVNGPGPANTVRTAQRVVTGLSVGVTYRYRVVVFGGDYTSVGVVGIGDTAYVDLPDTSANTLDYSFVATATSHTIRIRQYRPTGSGDTITQVNSAEVRNVTGWQGTTLRRTDANGTNVVVREDAGGQDTSGGTMTVTDYEAALAGPVVYTVTDGVGATATATTSLAAYRRNLFTNPTFATSGAGVTAVTSSIGWAAADSGKAVITPTTAIPLGGIWFYEALGDAYTQGVARSARVTVRNNAATAKTLYVRLLGYNAGGTGTSGGTGSSNPVGDAVTVPAGGTADLVVNGVVYLAGGPNGDITATRWAVYSNSGQSVGESVDILDALVEDAPTAGAHFHGSSPANGPTMHYWTGTANASVSVQTSPLSLPGVWVTLPATAVPSVPTAPTAVAAELVTDWREASPSNGSVHVIIGREDPIANPGPLALRSGTVDVWCRDYATAKALRALLAAGQTAHLRQPDHVGMDLYFVATGVSINPATVTTPQRWVASVSFTEVKAP